MKFTRRRAISPIIATLLLIAIAVAAGIILYVFVNGFAGGLTSGGGGQTTERLQMQSYNFVLSPGACACAQQILQIFLLNSGSGATTLSAVYFDGVLQTFAAAPTANTAIANGNAYYTSAAALVNDFTTAACTATAGAAGNFCMTVAGGAGSGSGLLYNAGATGQLDIVFSPAQTAGTSHTIKAVSTTGATFVFSVTAGRTG
ncbi:MAG TPA: archaellin/type IV pilin N-terminal domain-containing protein [Nitrososphaerales archaeon]|nr:archaellin/type IV pilin N-terminal domain-containing protein [Nitrososphaerales archaeon]HUK75093.1 archaellin/type IV pilin N-terminal domain-containing protein [Nitrososphaerales archaeon]